MELAETLASGQLSKADIDWAVTFPAQKAEQIKQHCLSHPEANKDLILEGHMLDLVYADFNGLFAGPIMIAARKPEPTRQILLARLNWMAEQPQTPQDLKEKLKKTAASISTSRWESPQDLVKGETIWKGNVQDEVVRRISPTKNQDELPLPIDPYKKAWTEYWTFEYGRRGKFRSDVKATK
ncbi:hypothetical protein A3E46_01340 [Candidatus Woesebacteria bacterium RIFCSPHIGHO2_12_FULL_46_16]|uniref:Uncharacterized protein n=1 Tax=Candidatus Woesebacteria bacterium RIFCSPHIGHO2_12_FULL_46_16 TaxID=1802513 RepID=A0A1F8B171_9BACT|nr:MAG: hypothetical protein A3E46_01340 [Candidatus Woesebacteria bacterium RIFCSPHIGHO2_12_FULL_46_16]